MADNLTRRSALDALQREVVSCRRCPLHAGRTNAVFGAGSHSAALMFVGEAPGYHEDRLGEPFVGQAGNLLDRLLNRIGLSRGDVYIANVLKCRPPGNRDPQAREIEKCHGFLEKQIKLIEPGIICTLGNFSTRLLSGMPAGISSVHGRLQKPAGAGNPALFPVFHPAAALYSTANLSRLEEDFDRLAGLIGAGAGRAPAESGARTGRDRGAEDGAGGGQLGLF